MTVAQWLLEIKPDIHISAENECAFRWACRNGHLSVARWLVELKPELYRIVNVENCKIQYKIHSGLIKKGVVQREKETCAICQEKNIECETMCKHAFCLNCIQTWIDNDKHTCPYCRTNIGKEVKSIEFI